MPSITRRRLLATAAVAGSLGAALSRGGGTAYDPSEAAGWRHPQSTPGNTTAVDAAGPTTAGSVWQQEIPAELQYRFNGFARAGDRLLMPTHRRLVGVSTGGDRLFDVTLDADRALDRPVQIDTSPRVFGNRCLVAGGASVYALGVADGQPRWRYDVNSSIDGVVLLGNTLYLSARVGSEYALIAVDATSGTQRWRRDRRFVPLAADVDRLVVAEYDTVWNLGDSRLTAVDPESGRRLWQSDHRALSPSFALGTVALADDTVWHVADKQLTAVNAATGDVRWSKSLADDSASRGNRLAVADAVYVIEPEVTQLTAFELDGRRRWSRGLDGAEYGISVGGETVYAATQTGVEAVAATSGETRFRVDPASTAGDGMTPLVEEGAVYGLAGETLFGVTDS